MNTTQHKSLAIKAAINQGLLNEDKPLIALMNIHGLQKSVNDLTEAFPDHFKHCFAVKANPYLKFLEVLKNAGMGAEVASSTELEISLNAGFIVENMVFDTPVKTHQEIDRALSLGIAFNIDNFQELERVSDWLKINTTTSSIGFRINPQIGAGAVESTSTATMTSKFGIGLNDSGNREKVINACRKYSWIDCIHVHVGSVACPLSLIAKGIRAATNLAEEINENLNKRQITKLNIGGGLPVDFTQDEDNPSFKEYAEFLRDKIPELFGGMYHVTTEFGRAISAKNAITIGRVEYTKETGGRSIALTHIGVQTLVRTVYEPDYWKRRISAYSSQGILKIDDEIVQDIAGPACFSGDLIAKERLMPRLQANDYIMVHDTGAYHFSNHYQYNALPRLPVYGYTIDKDNKVSFEIISQGQSTQDVINDYS